MADGNVKCTAPFRALFRLFPSASLGVAHLGLNPVRVRVRARVRVRGLG